MLVSQDYLTESVDAVLDNAVYLTEAETLNNPKICPVIENARLGMFITPFSSLAGIMEAYDLSGDEALLCVAEANEIDPAYITVSINDYDIIAEPEIVNEFSNYVVNPISEDSTAYQLMDICLESWAETGDDSYLDYYVEDALFDDETDMQLLEGTLGTVTKAYIASKAGKKLLKTAAGALGGYGKDIVKNPLKHKKLALVGLGVAAYKNRDKIQAAVASKIAALRSKLEDLRARQMAPELPPQQKNVIQRAIERIKEMIRTLMDKIRGRSSAPAEA